MINFAEYKKKLNLETVTIYKVRLDVYFSYSKDFGFQIEAVEDETGVQDLMPILDDSLVDKIDAELTEIYRKNGWL
jgi:hypothetical protein